MGGVDEVALTARLGERGGAPARRRAGNVGGPDNAELFQGALARPFYALRGYKPLREVIDATGPRLSISPDGARINSRGVPVGKG